MSTATGDSGSFSYANPATIHWGAGCLTDRLKKELVQRGLSRAFVVTTRSVAGKPKLGGKLREILDGRLVGEYSAIGQHAPANEVADAARAVSEAQPDVLISFGGGSPIDAAKAIAFAIATGLDLAAPDAADKARSLRPNPEKLLPHIAIPTTLSAAEMSGSSGFSTVEGKEKVGLRGEGLVPKVVILDAELSLETPQELWLSTGIRSVDHAVETLWAAGSHPQPDALALESLRRLQASLRATHADPSNLAARTESQLGMWLSYSLPGAAAAGLSHTLGKRMGSRHGIPHGETSCLLLPHVMRYLAPRTEAIQARIAAALGAENAADGVAQLVSDLGLPNHLSAYGLSDDDLVEAARPVATDSLPLDDLVGIYRAAL
jgi:alcohol dehydrogenase class IV